MLEIRDLRFSYGMVPVLKGIDIHVNPGEIVAVIGANGAGKTTTLRCISGLVKPESGQMVFQGEDLRKCRGAHRVARLGITQVLEGRRVFPHLTVLENLTMGSYLRRDAGNVRKDLEKVFDLFPRLRERTKQDAGTLSGGEQQMLALARGMMSKPKLLVMDEPSMGLAPAIVVQLGDVIKQIGAMGTTILLVEQNAQMALSLSNRAYVMELGRIVATDTGANLLQSELVVKSYLGK